MKKVLPAIVLGSLLTVMALPAVVLAQEEVPEGCTMRHVIEIGEESCPTVGNLANKTTEPNIWGMCCMMNTIHTATNWLFMILMLVAVIMIVVGGFLFITASGDPEKAGKAKTYIVYALIGIAIAVFARVLPSIVKFIMGV